MTLKEAIRILATAGVEMYCKICTVDSVDVEARTVDCTPIDESAPLVGVNLQASQEGSLGVVLFPTVGSYIVVSFINPAVAVVALCDQVEKVQIDIGQTSATITGDGVDAAVGDMTMKITPEGITLNGGELGGLVKIEQLTKMLNDLIGAFNTHTHELPTGAVAVTGSATAQANPAPVVVPAIAQAHPVVERKTYEDNKVKH